MDFTKLLDDETTAWDEAKLNIKKRLQISNAKLDAELELTKAIGEKTVEVGILKLETKYAEELAKLNEANAKAGIARTTNDTPVQDVANAPHVSIKKEEDAKQKALEEALN